MGYNHDVGNCCGSSHDGRNGGHTHGGHIRGGHTHGVHGVHGGNRDGRDGRGVSDDVP